MVNGFRGRNGQIAAPPYTNGPYTFSEQMTFSGGVAGANTKGNVWYVDGDLSASGDGTSWDTAYITIQEAVTAASAHDVIYISAITLTDYTGDPGSYDENIIIPYATSSLALIGISRGLTQGGLPQIKIGGSSTTEMLKIRAPGCLIMNLGFNGASSTGGGILLDDDNTAKSAFGTTIINCHFKNCKKHATNAASGGAIMWGSAGNAWQVRISDCHFYKNLCDICVIGTSNTVPQDVVIENCHFSDSPASTTCNIYTGGSGFGGGLVINNNTFGALPNLSSGDTNLYTSIDTYGTESSGIFSNNVFGADGTTAGWGDGKAAADIEDGIWIVNCHSQAGLIVREAT